MSKILLGEKSSGCSDLDFLEVEATLPVEQNVGGPAITDDTCVSLGTFILVPLPWIRSPAQGHTPVTDRS